MFDDFITEIQSDEMAIILGLSDERSYNMDYSYEEYLDALEEALNAVLARM